MSNPTLKHLLHGLGGQPKLESMEISPSSLFSVWWESHLGLPAQGSSFLLPFYSSAFRCQECECVRSWGLGTLSLHPQCHRWCFVTKGVHTPETNVTFCVNCTQIKKKKKEDLSDRYGNSHSSKTFERKWGRKVYQAAEIAQTRTQSRVLSVVGSESDLGNH